jgi:hypothetical protein
MEFNMLGMRLAISILGLSILVGNANASLLSIDYAPNSGDNWITRDTATGLDWLDVSLTTSQTFDQVLTGIWYQNGFRYATKGELQVLFQDAGTPDDVFNLSFTHPTETLALAQLLGPTLISGGRVTVMGFTGTYFSGVDISLLNYTFGNRFSALLGKVDYMSFGPYGEAHFTGGHPFSDQADANYGSFLVRDVSVSAVPEPNTSILLLGGLVVLGIRARRNLQTRTG